MAAFIPLSARMKAMFGNLLVPAQAARAQPVRHSANAIGGGSLSPENIAQIVDALKSTAEFQWIQQRMQSDAGIGDGLDDGAGTPAARPARPAPRRAADADGDDTTPADGGSYHPLPPEMQDSRRYNKTAGERFAETKEIWPGKPVAQVAPESDAVERLDLGHGYNAGDQAAHQLAMKIAARSPGKPYAQCLDEARAELARSPKEKREQAEKFSRQQRRDDVERKYSRGALRLNDEASNAVRRLALKRGISYGQAVVEYLEP